MANQPKKYKKFVATAATATLVASAIVPVASAASFSDVSDSNEFAKFIDALTDEGIINGYPSTNTFKPGALLTRGQVVKMLGRWVENNGVELPSDWKTKAYFKDVPTNHKDQELVKYAALVAKAGVFGGAAGNLMAEKNITRQQMAKVLNGAYAAVNGQSLIEIAEGVDNVRIPDLLNASAEYEAAIQALMDLEISSTTSGNFRPLENVTRGQFSKFLYNTINFEASDVAPFEIKAVNSTTVEVIFDQDIENIDKVKFEIEGLDIKGAVVKQTSKRTAVLTTSEQKGGTEYTVKVDGEKAGTFVGIAAVIPTAIKTVVASQQGIIGKEVTLSAEVTVAEGQSKAGIPVTFNIVNDKNTNDKIEVEAFTNDKGVATYTYTRYYAGIDSVSAYATSKSSVNSSAKVYWASALQLEVKEVKEGNALTDGAKKVYEVYGDKNDVVFVAFEENLNVRSNNVTDVTVTNSVGYYDEDGDFTTAKEVTPYVLTNGDAKYVAIQLDKNGKGSFTLSGEDASVTPIVYAADYTLDKNDKLVDDSDKSADDGQYSKTALQVKAPTVKWSHANILSLDVKAEGTEDAAVAKSLTKVLDGKLDSGDDLNLGGRQYTATVTDKDGKLAPKGSSAYVTFGDFKDNVYVIIGDKVEKVVEDKVYTLTVGSNGEASFRVIADGDRAYATPTVFLNTAGQVSPAKLDKNDVQVEAETTYFTKAEIEEATLKVIDAAGKEVTSVAAKQKVTVVYQSVDQNGFPYADGKQYDVTFELSTTFGELEVDGNAKVQNNGRTYTYTDRSNSEGKATATFTATSATDVNISISGANGVLPVKDAKVTFTRAQEVTSPYTGVVDAINTTNETITFVGKDAISYKGGTYFNQNGTELDKDEFEELVKANEDKIRVTAKKNADGIWSFEVVSLNNQLESALNAVNTASSIPAVVTALTTYGSSFNPAFSTLKTDAQKTAVATFIYNERQSAAGLVLTQAGLTNAYNTQYTVVANGAADAVKNGTNAATVEALVLEVPGLDLSAINDNNKAAVYGDTDLVNFAGGTVAQLQAVIDATVSKVANASKWSAVTGADTKEKMLAALQGVTGINLSKVTDLGARAKFLTLGDLVTARATLTSVGTVNMAIDTAVAANENKTSAGIVSVVYDEKTDATNDDTLEITFTEDLDLADGTVNLSNLGITFEHGNVLGAGAVATYSSDTDKLTITLGSDHDIVENAVLKTITVNDKLGFVLDLSAVEADGTTLITTAAKRKVTTP